MKKRNFYREDLAQEHREQEQILETLQKIDAGVIQLEDLPIEQLSLILAWLERETARTQLRVQQMRKELACLSGAAVDLEETESDDEA